LIRILLPLIVTEGQRLSADLFDQVFDELTYKFGGRFQQDRVLILALVVETL